MSENFGSVPTFFLCSLIIIGVVKRSDFLISLLIKKETSL